jgi:pyruvate dehydrogenase E2 component (dihydrolipoamide acetyltransferase)
VGTYGLDTASAPVPTFCHVPITILLGAVTDKVLARDGKPVIRPVLPLTINLDHRFVDGYQAATMARIFREYLDDPAALDPVPTRIPPRKKQHTNVRSNGKSPATARAGRPNSSNA